MRASLGLSLALVGLLEQCVSSAWAQGTVTTPIGSLNDESVALALDPSGKIVVAGFTNVGTHYDFAVVRYNPDLTLDSSFDGDGIATLDMVGNDDRINAVAVQPDGKIVAAGFFWTAGTNDMAVLRYNVDGSLDTSFDSDGIALVTMAGDDQARAVAIQDDGKIVISGFTNGSGNYDFVVVRFNPDGSKDNTFDGDGIAITDFGAINNRAEAVAVQSDGRIVAAGDYGDGAGRDYMVVRYNTNGTLDTGFDTDGIQTTDFLSTEDNARFVVIQSDGKIVVTGSTNNGVDLDISAARYNTNGSLDTTFDTDGRVVTDLGAWDFSFGADLGPGGTLLIAGHTTALGNFDFAAVRYNSNGSLDTTFDTDGIVITPIGAGVDVGFGIAVESSGNIVVGGSSNNGSNLDVAVVRYCPNGSLQTNYSNSFGYRKPITVFSSQVGGSTDLSDFPVLLRVTDPNLRTTGFGGRVQKNDGADIVFREACLGAPLDHEVELYVPNTGELVAWVKVPLLRHDVDTVLFMYYGNATVGCPTENPAGVWSNGHRGVWHLQENPGDPAPQFIDSTTGQNHGTAFNNPGTTSGRIQNGLLFDDTSERHVLANHDAYLQLPGAMTVSAWISSTDVDIDVGSIMMKWGVAVGDENYWLGKLNQTDLGFVVDGWNHSVLAGWGLVNDGAFHHIVGVADPGVGQLILYIDGVAQSSSAYDGVSVTGTGGLRIGNGEVAAQEFNGTVDEVRVASVARSAGWIETEFRNQNNPGSFLSLGAEQAAPFNAPWVYTYRKKITIDSTKVCGSTNLLDFPVLVSLVDPDLRSVANGGKLTSASGYDLVFRDNTGQGNLDFEVEQYDPTNGTLVAWVRVPSLSFSTNTDIYMYYGNSAVSCSVQTPNARGVWNSGYKGVWHLREDPTGAAPQVLDSTSNLNHGTSQGAMTSGDQIAGRIDGSLDFDGIDDVIDAGAPTSLDMGSGDLTLEAWVRTTSVLTHRIAGKGSAGPGGKRYFLTIASADCAPGQLKAEIDDDTTKKFVCSAATYNDGGWHHAAVVREGTNLRLYVDGVAEVPTDITGYGSLDSPRPFGMGALWDENGPGLAEFTEGGLDEVRISSVARSACWLQTGYANQSSPGTFYSVGVEESTPPLPAVVSLSSFTAEGQDGEVLLEWRTASELDNLGFHLYRARAKDGSRERVTSAAIPGLGSSPVGATYRYRDREVVNGVTYFYWLEDIETTGKTTLHGPISVSPQAGVAVHDDRNRAESRIVFGEPSKNALRVVTRDRNHVVLELETKGFYAEPLDDGTVVIEIPGFEEIVGSESGSLPVKRSWVEAVAGRGVSLGKVRSGEEVVVGSLRPAGAAVPDLSVSRRGAVRAGRKRARGARTGVAGLEEQARLVTVAYQGDEKKALVELAPLRWNEATGQLSMTGRLEVEVSFAGREAVTRGRRRRREARSKEDEILAYLHTRERGLYRVRYDEIGRGRQGGLPVDSLHLSRQGRPVAYRVEPYGPRFGPGTSLYFLSEGAEANPFGQEAVYELAVGAAGIQMESLPSGSLADGGALHDYWHRLEREENRYYQAALLDAPDLWLWDLVFAPDTKTFPFEVEGLVSEGSSPRLTVWLQGVSDVGSGDDHHVWLYVNRVPVAESFWDGKHPKTVNVDLPPGVLHEGENALDLENVGDTGAPYSVIMLDRFAVDYPRSALAKAGRLEGTWSEGGIAEISGFPSGALAIDTTGDRPRWIVDARSSGRGSVRLGVEPGRSYLVVDPESVLHPGISRPLPSRLKSTTRGADYLVIGPASFLEQAGPLLELRRRQGLRVVAAPLEEVYAEFGYGEEMPSSIREFIAYAYHEWRPPSPRYVLLLGDGTYDFKNYLGTGVVNRVPPMIVQTSFLWTASDTMYGAVHGDDNLPDVAVGRLPAANVDEVRLLVEKILRYETGDRPENRSVFLIADDPDEAGDFEQDADDLASSVYSEIDPHKIFLRRLGPEGTRRAIVEAFDSGAETMSYLGHGGIHLWAHEDVFDLSDVDRLEPQAQQPLLLTMNCLNGYFHFPYFDSLAEKLVKAEGKGAIAAFSPSGLSLNTPAHLYHRALLEELSHGGHRRLGDAVLAAQEAYTETGAFPELLTIYLLLGDPALELR